MDAINQRHDIKVQEKPEKITTIREPTAYA
jgi:hypothetical protein